MHKIKNSKIVLKQYSKCSDTQIDPKPKNHHPETHCASTQHSTAQQQAQGFAAEPLLSDAVNEN